MSYQIQDSIHFVLFFKKEIERVTSSTVILVYIMPYVVQYFTKSLVYFSHKCHIFQSSLLYFCIPMLSNGIILCVCVYFTPLIGATLEHYTVDCYGIESFLSNINSFVIYKSIYLQSNPDVTQLSSVSLEPSVLPFTI